MVLSMLIFCKLHKFEAYLKSKVCPMRRLLFASGVFVVTSTCLRFSFSHMVNGHFKSQVISTSCLKPALKRIVRDLLELQILPTIFEMSGSEELLGKITMASVIYSDGGEKETCKPTMFHYEILEHQD